MMVRFTFKWTNLIWISANRIKTVRLWCTELFLLLDMLQRLSEGIRNNVPKAEDLRFTAFMVVIRPFFLVTSLNIIKVDCQTSRHVFACSWGENRPRELDKHLQRLFLEKNKERDTEELTSLVLFPHSMFTMTKQQMTAWREKKKEQQHSQIKRTYAGRWTELKKALNSQDTTSDEKTEMVKPSQAANTESGFLRVPGRDPGWNNKISKK